MRKILTIALALTLCSGVAMAQTDVLGVYTDTGGTNCAFNPGVFQLLTLYLVLDTEGATASKFKITDLAGMTATGSAVTAGFLSIGTFAAGIEIAYPTCQTGKVVIGNLGYFHQAEVMDCSRTVRVDPHPGSQVPGEVVGVDCAQPFGNIETVRGGRAWGGADAELCGGCVEPPLATQESTWGGIKALYR